MSHEIFAVLGFLTFAVSFVSMFLMREMRIYKQEELELLAYLLPFAFGILALLHLLSVINLWRGKMQAPVFLCRYSIVCALLSAYGLLSDPSWKVFGVIVLFLVAISFAYDCKVHEFYGFDPKQIKKTSGTYTTPNKE